MQSEYILKKAKERLIIIFDSREGDEAIGSLGPPLSGLLLTDVW